GGAARFNNPSALAVDSSGNVYVADTNNNTVRKITAAGVVTTLAGTAGSAGSGDGNGSAARFDYPSGVAVDSAGNVYVADAGNATIRQISPSGAVTTPAGSAGSVGSVDGTGSAARFNYPSGLAVDGSGNLYVAEVGNSTLRKITPAWQVTTLAGTAGNRGSADGTGSSATFNSPSGLAVDGAGNVYVADTGNHLIRKVTGAGVVTTLAGTAGINGVNDGTGSVVRFNLPHGVAVSGSGSVYVADTYNNTIRLGGPSPQVNALTFGTNNFAANAVAGAQVNFTYNVTNSGTKPWGVHHLLALRQFDYTKVQMGDLAITLPGTDKAVNFSFTAPSTPGTYQYRVQPLENGIEWFGGEVFLTLTVGGVGPQTNALTYGTHSFPASATPGATVTFTYNVTNSGTKTWGTNHLLALRQFDYTSSRWVPSRPRCPAAIRSSAIPSLRPRLRAHTNTACSLWKTASSGLAPKSS
ncbi:MAG: NHL repeat-containing protein, partial [Arthrobacter sp.]